MCVGGPYISDGPIKMQQAVWSKDGSVIAVRVKAGASAGKGFRRYDGAFWIDAYDFRKHRLVSEGPTIRTRLEVKYQRNLDPVRDIRGIEAFPDKSVNNAPFGVRITQNDIDPPADTRVVALPLASLMLLR